MNTPKIQKGVKSSRRKGEQSDNSSDWDFSASEDTIATGKETQRRKKKRVGNVPYAKKVNHTGNCGSLHVRINDHPLSIPIPTSPPSPGAISSDGSYGLHSTEVPPNIEFYRMTAERTMDQQRPSMGDLLEGTVFRKMDEMEKKDDGCIQIEIPVPQAPEEGSEKKVKEQKKFGWIEGVFVRCLQNIIGVILYIRLSWVAGQAGILLGSLIILLATSVTTITTISTSALTTNGEIKGGGVYYMISRTLGPEFGGSIGLIFCCANAVGAALYLVGFAETVIDLFKEHNIEIFDGGVNDLRLIGVAIAIVLMAVIVIGISIESKLQQIMLIPFTISVIAFMSGSFIHTEAKELKGFTGYKWTTFSTNLLPEFRKETFFSMFSIYFPAATGIMAGANISGDLKNPQTAIPKGTLLAIFCSTIIYLVTLICTASTWVKDADGVNHWEVENGKFVSPNCTMTDSCKFGLMNDFQAISDMSVWSPLITVGIFASCLSSALGSLVSAPKILQAVCADNLFPYIGFFSKGSGKDNAPRRAYALTFAITVAMVLLGNLNIIAPIISNFFLCSYALVNYACFDASFSDSPGFRPAFKYYNMWISLFGSVVCIIIMFIMSWITALITLFVFAVLFIFLKKHKPEVNWGSSTQANQYKSTLQGLFRMNKYDEHVKNYRPQILLLTGDPSTRPGLVDFAASITRGGSLLICANILTHLSTHRVYSMMRRSDIRANSWLKERGIKSFCVTVSAKNLFKGTHNLTQAVGIGKMVPNIVMVGFKSDWSRGVHKVAENNAYLKAIQASFDKHLSVVILRNRDEGFDVLDAEKRVKRYSMQWPKGEPPRGRLSLNPEKAQEIFGGGARQFFKNMKNRTSFANVLDANPDKPQFTQDYSPEQTPGHTPHLTPRPSTDMAQVPSPFCVRLKKATIDVWWLSDDGGLTLLLPHLLTLTKSYLEGAHLRVFTVSASPDQIQSEQANMAALMRKFRIEYKDLHIITEMGGKPLEKTLETFNTLIQPFVTHGTEPSEGMVTEEELQSNKAKTYRQLRCSELLHKHSEDAELIVINLPIPTRDNVSSSLYLCWLEMLSRGLPPTLMVRGNHNSVLTFYS